MMHCIMIVLQKEHDIYVCMIDNMFATYAMSHIAYVHMNIYNHVERHTNALQIRTMSFS